MGSSAKLTRTAIGFLSGTILINHATAHEPGDAGQYLPGVTMGLGYGAAPPPGVYFDNTILYIPKFVGNDQNNGTTLKIWAEIPSLSWSTGWNFLGAKVVMAVVQPVYDSVTYPSTASGPPFAGAIVYPVMHNTVLNPLTLSWNIGTGWFLSTGFVFYAPDGSRYDNSPNPDYWTYEFNGAISYLADGWNLTAHFVYDWNTASEGHTGAFAKTQFAPLGIGYRSGDQAFLDVTATKRFGKWEIGPVAYLKWQTTSDHPGGDVSCATMATLTASLLGCGQATQYAVGGLIGYDWGPVALKVMATDSVYTRDYFQGWNIWAKLLFPLWVAVAPATERGRTNTFIK